MLDQYYVHQLKNYMIGNFINCTPTIKLLSDHYKTKVKVYFHDQVVEKMYRNCDFIQIIGEEETDGLKCLFKSNLVNAIIPDWKYAMKSVAKKLDIDLKNKIIPHTYVDPKEVPIEYRKKEYVVIIRGHGDGSSWVDRKDPGDDIYKYFISKLEKKYHLVFIGADVDYKRYFYYMKDWIKKPDFQLNNIDKSLGLIRGARFIIGNDTGMYHVAGAYNKPVFVFWKDSFYPKSKSPGKCCVFSFKNNWYKDFDGWYKKDFDADYFYKLNPKRMPGWRNWIKMVSANNSKSYKKKRLT